MKPSNDPRPRLSREDFLRAGAGAGAVLSASTALGAAALPGAAASQAIGPSSSGARAHRAESIRCDAARAYLSKPLSPPITNGDDERYADRRASFTKTLPSNDLGEVDLAAYAALLAAFKSANPGDFERIPQAPGCAAKLNNPQAAFAFELAGVDSNATRIVPPPAFASAAAASDMAEVYWRALVRDVPFRAFEDSPLIAAAAADLNAFSVPSSAALGKVSPATIFRGEAPGCRIGPHLSQFLWVEIPYGIARIEQRYRFPARNQQFLTSMPEWLACQRGARPSAKLQFDATPRFISSFRELAEYVHQDFSYQPYLSAALAILQWGLEAMAPTNPYRSYKVEFGDITFGNKNVLSLLAQAALLGQKGSWYQKWLLHRRARPEVYAARVEVQAAGTKQYDVSEEIVRSAAVARTKAAYGTRLLPLAFPEGSPTHPSYPAAHAATAGACITVMKAFFNKDFPIPNPVQATQDGSALEAWTGPALTLGNEIDKLAANVALGRDAAGVHFRSDSMQGLLVGEQQALGLLADYSRTYNERFAGFALTRLDGRRLVITQGEIRRA
jgi:hypothetical protein